jgi:hypothetical protein
MITTNGRHPTSYSNTATVTVVPELRSSAWWEWDGNGVLGAEWKQPYTLSGHLANYSHYAQLSVAALLHEVDDGGNEQDYVTLGGMIDAQQSSSDPLSRRTAPGWFSRTATVPLHGTHKPCIRQPKPTNSPSVGGYAGGFAFTGFDLSPLTSAPYHAAAFQPAQRLLPRIHPPALTARAESYRPRCPGRSRARFGRVPGIRRVCPHPWPYRMI